LRECHAALASTYERLLKTADEIEAEEKEFRFTEEWCITENKRRSEASKKIDAATMTTMEDLEGENELLRGMLAKVSKAYDRYFAVEEESEETGGLKKDGVLFAVGPLDRKRRKNSTFKSKTQYTSSSVSGPAKSHRVSLYHLLTTLIHQRVDERLHSDDDKIFAEPSTIATSVNMTGAVFLSPYFDYLNTTITHNDCEGHAEGKRTKLTEPVSQQYQHLLEFLVDCGIAEQCQDQPGYLRLRTDL